MDPIMLLIVMIVASLVCAPLLLYLSEKEGWRPTTARIGRYFRSLRQKPSPAILKKMPETEAKTQWVEAFNQASGEKGMMQITPTDAKHQIIRYFYYRSSFGEVWPRWKCKCGAEGSAPVMSGGMQEAEERAKRDGAKHVETQTQNEWLIEKNKEGPWAF